jgi:hypothetical protein
LEWKQAVEYLSSAVETPQSNWRNLDYPVVLNALTGWLNSSITEVKGVAESAYEASRRRVVFLFNNDYTLTLGTGITPTIARMSKQVTGDQPLPFEGMLAENWDYVRAVNGWRRRENLSNEDLDNFLLRLSEEVGEFPTLILPLICILDNLEENLKYASAIEALGPAGNDKKKQDEDNESWIRFLNLFSEEKMQKTIDTLGLDLILCDDYEYMSEHCDYSRFLNLLGNLDGGERIHKSIDSFFDSGHLPDGTFFCAVYDLDPEEEILFNKLASECGLNAGPWQEGKFEATGDVYLVP